MIGYFGPAGTFTHQALRTVSGEEAVPYSTVAAVLDAVRAGEVEAGLVPIENSVEGGVTATLDNLALGGDPLVIVREVLLPVSFVLAVRPGYELADVQRILADYYADEAFIRVAPIDLEANTEGGFFNVEANNDSNRVDLFVFGNDERMLVVARLDNLGKGASGAAVQAMNVHLGINESLGLV